MYPPLKTVEEFDVLMLMALTQKDKIE